MLAACKQASDPAVLQLQLTVAAELLLVLEFRTRVPVKTLLQSDAELTMLGLPKENGMISTIGMK